MITQGQALDSLAGRWLGAMQVFACEAGTEIENIDGAKLVVSEGKQVLKGGSVYMTFADYEKFKAHVSKLEGKTE